MPKIPCGGFSLGEGLTMTNGALSFTGGSGKIWHKFDLTTSEVEAIGNGDKIVKKFDKAYEPKTFNGDYFLCSVNNTGNTEGQPLYTSSPMQKIYLDFEELAFVAPYLIKTVDYAMYDAGFDHNYYRTILLWAGSDNGEPISGAGALEGKNVIYLQDVTQQAWEINPVEGMKPVEVGSREGLDKELANGAYVLSIKGKDAQNTFAFLMANDDAQAAYWDTTDNACRWANVEAGKVYPVVFDGTAAGQHGTLRWLIPNENITTDVETGAKVAVELSDAIKEAMLTTGLEFEADKYAAEILEDTTEHLKSYCIGNGEKSLVAFISFNEPFEIPTEEHILEFIGRPVAYVNSSFEWYEDDGETVTWYTEEEGVYTWSVVIQDASVILVVPKSYPDRFIVYANVADSFSSTYLVRHTITIKTPDLATIPNNDYALNLSFSAVNAQWGDDTLGYILYSDFREQEVNWVVPASGYLGQVSVSGETHSVATWYPVIRIIGGSKTVEDTLVPCLYAEYFNSTTGQITKVEIVNEGNVDNYTARDFRSEIAVVASYGDKDYKK